VHAAVGACGAWSSRGLHPFQDVTCVVVGHRGRFGLEVKIVSPASDIVAFIDFVLLAKGRHLQPADFPPIGTTIEARTLAYMPNGELRLSPRSTEA
jgi:hypothetical protein